MGDNCLTQLLRDYGLQVDVDEAIAEYIINALEDVEADDLIDVLTSYIPEIGEALSSDQQLQFLSDLRSRVSAAQEQLSSPGTSTPRAKATDECDLPLSSKESSCDDPASPAVNDEDDPLVEDVQFLISLVPQIEEPIVRYVMQHISANDRTHAAQYLVENSSPEGIQRLRLAQVRTTFARMCGD